MLFIDIFLMHDCNLMLKSVCQLFYVNLLFEFAVCICKGILLPKQSRLFVKFLLFNVLLLD